MKPTAPAERLPIVDIVRGFALFGILLVNMLAFSGPYLDFSPWTLSTTVWDRITELLVLTLGQGAFYSIFSFLFGLSYALQADRAAARGETSSRMVRSRMTWLLIFGLLHGFLIWDGDILAAYATAGFFLTRFANVTTRRTLIWAAGLLSTMIVLVALVATLPFLAEELFEEPVAEDIAGEIERVRTGDFIGLAAERLSDWPFVLAGIVIQMPWFLGLFLIGRWVVKSGKLANWRNERPFMIRVLRMSLPIAMGSKALLASTIVFQAGEAVVFIALALDYFFSASLGVTYICLISLLLRRLSMEGSVLRHIEAAGRMTLTNYLCQSLLLTFVFYGSGLGQYGQWGLSVVCLLACLLFAAQMVFSRLWLDRFRFGPMEWLWRVLAYKTRLS